VRRVADLQGTFSVRGAGPCGPGSASSGNPGEALTLVPSDPLQRDRRPLQHAGVR